MRRASQQIGAVRMLATQVIDGLEARFLAMLPPSAPSACRGARRER
jgi:hypothetical protein